MELLNDNEFDRVYAAVAGCQLQNRELSEELLDHLCCFIEEQMACGKSFDESYEHAMKSIAPNGLQEIEEEVFFILNFNYQTTMKRLLYASSFLTCFCFCLYFLLKHLKYPESNWFLFTGNLSLLLGVIPSLGIIAYRNRGLLSGLDKTRMLLGLSSGAILTTGMIFKHYHFPYANILFVSGTLVFTFVFLPVFFYQLYKEASLKHG